MLLSKNDSSIECEFNNTTICLKYVLNICINRFLQFNSESEKRMTRLFLFVFRCKFMNFLPLLIHFVLDNTWTLTLTSVNDN